MKKSNIKEEDIFKTDDGYGNLRIGIIKQAVDDYKRALKRHDVWEIKYFERWFLSEWAQKLSGNNGAYILENIKNEGRTNKNA